MPFSEHICPVTVTQITVVYGDFDYSILVCVIHLAMHSTLIAEQEVQN